MNELMRRRRALMAVAQDTPILPSGYQQVDYLTANGSSYFQVQTALPQILPGFTVKTTAVQNANDSQYRVVCGGGNDDVYIGYMCYPATNNKVGAFYGTRANAYVEMSSLYGLKTECVTVIAETYVTATVKNSSGTQTLTNQSTNLKASNMFRVGYNGVASAAFKGKIYEIDVWDTNNNLYFRFVPCYRKSDNVAGMYETVNDLFKPSGTSTPFGWGND